MRESLITPPGKRVRDREVERETSKDPTFQALTRQMEAAEKGLKESKENLQSKRGELGRLRTRQKKVQKTRDTLVKERNTLEQEVTKMEGESEQVEKIIESGATTTEEKEYVRNLRKSRKRKTKEIIEEEEKGESE